MRTIKNLAQALADLSEIAVLYTNHWLVLAELHIQEMNKEDSPR